MPQLNSIRPTLISLSHDEAFQRIQDYRNNRLFARPSTRKRKTPRLLNNATQALSHLGDEELEKLERLIEEKLK